MSVTSTQVVSLLENVLFEAPAMASADWGGWLGQSVQNPAETDLGGLAQGMAASPEFGIAERIIGFYEGALDRVPSGAEVAYYVGLAEAGLTSAQVAQGVSAVSPAVWAQIASYFTASPEFSQSGSGQVDGLYEGFLGRAPSASEAAYYADLLKAGTSVSTLMLYFANSPEFAAHHAGDALKVANFGVLITEANGAGQSDPVLAGGVGDQPILIVPTSGANYASQPSYVTGASWGTLIGVTDNAVLTVDAPTTFGSSVTSVAAAITTLESAIQAHHLAWGVYGGNTYVVESITGVPGPADTTVIELTGVHALSASSSAGLIHILA